LLAEFRAHNAAPKKREFRATPATEADLRRQFELAKQNRPTPAKSSTPSPLADYSNSKLAWLATHSSATASDKANARAELARRGTTITPSGIVSQSTRRQPRK
jgi:hypothetical protein